MPHTPEPSDSTHSVPYAEVNGKSTEMEMELRAETKENVKTEKELNEEARVSEFYDSLAGIKTEEKFKSEVSTPPSFLKSGSPVFNESLCKNENPPVDVADPEDISSSDSDEESPMFEKIGDISPIRTVKASAADFFKSFGKDYEPKTPPEEPGKSSEVVQVAIDSKSKEDYNAPPVKEEPIKFLDPIPCLVNKKSFIEQVIELRSSIDLSSSNNNESDDNANASSSFSADEEDFSNTGAHRLALAGGNTLPIMTKAILN